MKLTVKHIILFLFLLNVANALGQQQWSSKSKKAIKNLEEGIHAFNLKYYDNAISSFNEAIKTDNEFIEAYLILGDLYIEKQEYPKAIQSYRKGLSIKPDFFPRGFFILAKAELKEGLYEAARDDFNKFLEMAGSNDSNYSEAQRLIKNCNFAIKAKKNPVPFNPESLGPNINTPYDEYWPSISADEQILVYTSLIPIDKTLDKEFGNRQEDFFISSHDKDGWQKSKNLGPPINTEDNEGAQALSTDGQIMFYTACNREDGKGRCDIYFAKRYGNEWQAGINIGPPINTSKKETQPSISADGNTLYFVSDRTGGRGGTDIWCSTLTTDGFWGEPVNLGDSINTPFDEMSPFIHPDNQSLYFASNGHIGMGGIDLYLSKKHENGTWGKPENLGYPINTHHDETGLAVNAAGRTAYFSSDRLEGMGKDLYSFQLPENVRPVEVSYMKGVVYDEITEDKLRAHFEVIALTDGKIINEAYSNSVTGEFLVSIPVTDDYALNVSKEGYLFYSDNFSLTKYYSRREPLIKNVPLSPILNGEHVVLNNIFYEIDSYVLKKESRAELDKLTQFMKDNPNLVIEIGGHTDNTGSAEYNMQLSENRARSVTEYLISKGISEARLKYKGYGETKPVENNETEEGRAKNRRTEFTIIDH